jgi:3-oxoacyl-[acyl-carrier protein] reductase
LLATTETAVGGALTCILALRPHYVRRGFGRVITICTNLMQNPVVPHHNYTAAKGALLAFTRSAAKELGPLGVTVSMVSGDLLRSTDVNSATPEAVFEMSPLRHLSAVSTAPEDMADAVLSRLSMGACRPRAEPHR